MLITSPRISATKKFRTAYKSPRRGKELAGRSVAGSTVERAGRRSGRIGQGSSRSAAWRRALRWTAPRCASNAPYRPSRRLLRRNSLDTVDGARPSLEAICRILNAIAAQIGYGDPLLFG